MTLLSLSGAAHAQNSNRIDEEKVLDKQRQQKVEEIIKAREEEERKIRENPELYTKTDEIKLVEVEPNNILPADLSSVSALVPYKVRRRPSGLEVGLKYSLFDPVNYESDYASPTLISFENLYGSEPMYEIYANYKKNMSSLGSLGVELGYGFYKNDVDDTSFGSEISLSLQVISLGAKIILDAIRYEPYIAPYIGIGAYSVFFREENGASNFNGNTEVSYYFSGGVLLQMNWIDKAAAVEAYSEGGIENTYLFLEAKQFMASNAERDPDFSTDPTLGAGLSLEF